jgi:hypothetical protein
MLPEHLGRDENVALGPERVKVVKNELLLRMIRKLFGAEVDSYFGLSSPLRQEVLKLVSAILELLPFLFELVAAHLARHHALRQIQNASRRFLSAQSSSVNI